MVKLPQLRILRERSALTQGELAVSAGVTRATVQRIEQGVTARMSTVRKLAQALGVKPVELMEPEAPLPATVLKLAKVLAQVDANVEAGG